MTVADLSKLSHIQSAKTPRENKIKHGTRAPIHRISNRVRTTSLRPNIVYATTIRIKTPRIVGGTLLSITSPSRRR
jgi:hypothetical protein